MPGPDWYYDDLRQVGVDFDDAAAAAAYDDQQGNTLAAAEALIDRLGLGRDDEIADLGCGPGLFACSAARRCRKVHAVDVSAAMLGVARQRAQRMALANIVFHHAGFLGFHLPAGSLDLITTTFALHHLPDFWKAMAIVRMADTLKPGGRLYLKDVVFSCAPAAIPDVAERWVSWLTGHTGYARADAVTHLREEHSTFSWILEGLIERAGLRLLSITHEREVYGEYLAEKTAA